jgi:hypothetical protein
VSDGEREDGVFRGEWERLKGGNGDQEVVNG